MMYEQIVRGAIRGENYFIDGAGGTGKSYLITQIAQLLNESFNPEYGNDINVAITATTGIAAYNLNEKLDGTGLTCTTIHSFGGIGIGKGSAKELMENYQFTYFAKKRWQKTDVLIIDEISMLGGNLLSKLDLIAKEVRDSDAPFGGISLIVSGDFFQLPPINDIWAFKSSVWKELDFERIRLTEPKRYPNIDYFNMLSRFRLGEHTEEDYSLLEERYNITQEYLDNELDEIKPIYLSSKKAEVEKINKDKLNELEGKLYSFRAEDTTKYISGSRGSIKKYKGYLDKIIPDLIQIKIGSQIILKKNIDIQNGLVNGTKGIVTRVGSQDIGIKTYNGSFVLGKRTHSFKCDEFSYTRKQFPIMLAFALTIHSTQGLTLESAICDLGDNIFADGQAYVAMSRVRDLDGLYIRTLSKNAFKTSKEVLNLE